MDHPGGQDLGQWLIDLASDRPEEQEFARSQISARGAAAAPGLVQALREDQIGGVGRAQVLGLLAELAHPSTLPDVVATLADPRPIVRSAAINAIATFQNEEANDALIALLTDPDLDVVKHAAGMLGRRRSPRAVEPLVSLLNHAESGVRYVAVRALSQIGTEQTSAALDAHLLRETDPEVRAVIVAAQAEDPLAVENQHGQRHP